MMKRWQAHHRALRRGVQANRHLQAAWNKYGEGSFTFEVLEHVEDEQQLLRREGFHMTRLNANHMDFGYNLVEVDENANVRFSEDHKARISISLMGHPVSEANCRAMSESLKGRFISDEERARKAEAQRGRKHSEETKAKIRAHGNKGRKFGPLSPEHRKKLSEAHTGHTHSPESRAKMSAAHKGRPKSAEHCRKMAEALRGRKRTPESIEKQRATLLGRKRSPEVVAKTADALRGRKKTPEQRQRIKEGIRLAKLRQKEAENEQS